ncbi:uncharacterized protein LOC128202449 [Galleria mellonella]|uniref:Uncharacterized protein LOC128202449 n=1 Tax=Galleria mellonella TaxID=7137 RepID=A0ABM3N5B8_GALME|nr:uncharacterized protein LOC128202449 [Galleria mellonella]
MIGLLIALCLPVVGKTDTWNPVVSYIVLTRNSQLSDFDGAPRRVPNEQLQLSPPQPFHNSAPITNHRPEYQSAEDDGPDHPAHLAVIEHQTKGQLFLSRVVTEKMSQPLYTNTNKPVVNKEEQNNSKVDDQIHFPEDKPVNPDRTQTSSEGTVPYFTERESGSTTLKPIDIILSSGPNATEISVDDRASFDGDPCPAGQIKVNGKCVDKD